MSDKPRSEKRKRTSYIRARVTPEEHANFQERCSSRGFSEADFIRLRCLDLPPLRKRRKRSLNEVALADALGQLGKVGGNLNQIAHALNIIKMKSGDPQALASLEGLEHQLAKLLGEHEQTLSLIRKALLSHDPGE